MTPGRTPPRGPDSPDLDPAAPPPSALDALLFPATTLGLPAHAIGLTFLTLATALTLWSGYIYFRDYFRPAPLR